MAYFDLNNLSDEDLAKLSGRQLWTQALRSYSSPYDVNALNQMAQQRQQQYQQSLINAMAAGLGGKRMEPVRDVMLKQAMSNYGDQDVEGGYLSGGKFVEDPYAARKRQYEALTGYGKEIFDVEQAKADRLSREAVAKLNNQSSGSNNRLQQGGAMSLPDGSIVSAMFDPNKGQYVYQSDNGVIPVPPGARPTTPGTAGPLSAKNFGALLDQKGEEEESLIRLDRYEQSVGGANVGIRRWADSVAVKAKTLFGSKKLTPAQLAAETGKGYLQGLIGMFRTDIVGPGVMTEQDALRVVQAIGGNFDALQNPQVVEGLLRDMRDSKKRRIGRLNQQIDFSKKYYPGLSGGSPEGGSPPPQPVPQGTGNLTPEEKIERDRLRKLFGVGTK